MGDAMIFPTLTEADLMLPVYLVGAGNWNHQHNISRPSGFPQYQWLYCFSGEGELIIEGEKHTIKANQGMFLFPHIPHEYYAVHEPWSIGWLCFNGHQIEPLFRIAGIRKSGSYSFTNNEIIVSHLHTALSLTQSSPSITGLDFSKLIYIFLIDLIKNLTDSTPSIEQNAIRLQPVFRYIEQNFSKVITLEELARTIDVTPQHLCLLFRKTMKIRPFEYINRTRINKSKEIMFHDMTKKMYEIAEMVGFEHPSYFSSLFKRLEGMSPESFKKLHGM